MKLEGLAKPHQGVAPLLYLDWRIAWANYKCRLGHTWASPAESPKKLITYC